MVICPQCNIVHEDGEEFCQKCGKFLLIAEDPTLGEDKSEVKLVCPKCQYLYKKGKYCRHCGSLLMKSVPFQIADIQPPGEKWVRKYLNKWSNLLKEEKELESCMNKLDGLKDSFSDDVLHPIYIRYKDRLESLSPLHQEMEVELAFIRRRTLEQIDFFEKDVTPIQEKLKALQSLYQLGAVTRPDFIREKRELKREMRSRDKSLKKCRQILSLLPGEQEENLLSKPFVRYPLHRFNLWVAAAAILLIISGGTFFWQQHSQSSGGSAKEMDTSPSVSNPSIRPPAMTEDQELESIKILFDNIKQANLKKNIDLFMSCYARDFYDREGKREDTLKMWRFFNYRDLSYDLKEQRIVGDTAAVRLEWLSRISKKAGGKTEEKRTLLDVTLKREDGHWKIREIQTVS